MVQLYHFDLDIFRLHVWIRKYQRPFDKQTFFLLKNFQAQLVPQLIINYKLKSVAHMPMKAMIYKTLSTVVDDLFAYAFSLLRDLNMTDVNSHSIQLLYQDAIPSSFSLFPR